MASTATPKVSVVPRTVGRTTRRGAACPIHTCSELGSSKRRKAILAGSRAALGNPAALVQAASSKRRGPHAGARAVTLVVAEASVDDLPKNLKNIVMAFQMVPDPMARYKQLLYYAAKLPKLPKEFQVEENKVQGCVSQVWVVPTLEEDGTVTFQAESDSQLTKGLAALLCNGLSGSQPEEILKCPPDFIQMLGLGSSLTPSRNNGFLNMLLMMQKQTLQLTR